MVDQEVLSVAFLSYWSRKKIIPGDFSSFLFVIGSKSVPEKFAHSFSILENSLNTFVESSKSAMAETSLDSKSSLVSPPASKLSSSFIDS